MPTCILNDTAVFTDNPQHVIDATPSGDANYTANAHGIQLIKKKSTSYDDDDCTCEVTTLCLFAIFVGIVLLIVGFVYGSETVPENSTTYNPTPQEHVDMAPGLKISGGVIIGVGFAGLGLIYFLLMKRGVR
jgi:hypothetical protein